MIWLLFAVSLQAQEAELQAAREIMAEARFCFLITVDGDGQPRTRLMEPFAPEADMTVWFGTNPKTRKVEQLRRNSRVTLAYYDAKGVNYVTLAGVATVVTDAAERKRHWRPGWDAFFPGGAEGSNYVAIRFTPQRIELISNTRKIANAPATLRPAILERAGSRWRLEP